MVYPDEPSIKSLSLEVIEEAFGKALSGLLGRPATVNIRMFKLDEPSVATDWTGPSREGFRMELSGAAARNDEGGDAPVRI